MRAPDNRMVRRSSRQSIGAVLFVGVSMCAAMAAIGAGHPGGAVVIGTGAYALIAILIVREAGGA